MSRPGGRREFFSSANQLSSAGGAKGGARAGRQGRLPDWSDDARPHLFVEQRGNGLRSQVANSEADTSTAVLIIGREGDDQSMVCEE